MPKLMVLIALSDRKALSVVLCCGNVPPGSSPVQSSI